MNQITNDELKQYFKQIKLLLPILGKEERKFLSDFKVTVDEYAESHPGCSLDDIKCRFGEPEDVVHEYVSMLDQFQLCKRINLRNAIKKAIALLMILAVAYFGYRTVLLQRAYDQAQESMASYAVTVIE
ncbi:MAG: hypothetical protein IJ443_01575 [Firmicutes bacterium]|nr:hypothetical protein [Bacillota bacterium]